MRSGALLTLHNLRKSLAALAAFAICVGAAATAAHAQTTPAPKNPAGPQQFVTRDEVLRILSEGGFVTKAELSRKYATKEEGAELRAKMETLRAGLDALRASLRGLTERLPAAP